MEGHDSLKGDAEANLEIATQKGQDDNMRRAESARRAGLEAYKVSDLKKAQQLFSEAIKYENNNCVHFCNRCQVHLAMRRFVAANNDADAALALDSKCAKAWYRKGRALEGLGRNWAAITCFEKALGSLPVGDKMHKQVRAAVEESREHLKKHGAFTPGSSTWGKVHAAATTARVGCADQDLSNVISYACRLRQVLPEINASSRCQCENCVNFFRAIASSLQVHLWSMTLIHKGLKLKASNLHTLPDSSLILCLGRACEDPCGCDERDIHCLISQLGLDRDTSIRLLKKHDFDLVCAMLHA